MNPRVEVVTETFVVTAPPRRLWGALLALGVIAVLFGVIVLANIWSSLRLVAVFAGLLFLFAGVVQLVAAFSAARRNSRLIAALVSVALGVVLILWPETSLKSVAVLVGIAFVLWGVTLAIVGMRERAGGPGWAAGAGALLALVGVVVVLWPGPTVAILMALVGLSAILFGAYAIAHALTVRSVYRS